MGSPYVALRCGPSAEKPSTGLRMLGCPLMPEGEGCGQHPDRGSPGPLWATAQGGEVQDEGAVTILALPGGFTLRRVLY